MKKLRLLLYPFSLVYGLVSTLRNWCFDNNILSSFPIPGKSITIGNLSVGGTGKSPMVDYLLNLLLDSKIEVSTLSRGYGRKTKGLFEVYLESKASEVGDEPLMYKTKFGEQIRSIVCEERKKGVQHIRSQSDSLILLDDAFQHRKVKAGMQILLSTYNAPFFCDHLLPAGNLREVKSGYKRADVIIFTKCPEKLTTEEKSEFFNRLSFDPTHIFFSRIAYGTIQPVRDGDPSSLKKILVVTGIADPRPLVDELSMSHQVELVKFPDHYNYTETDLAMIHEKFDNFETSEKGIVTTEKDLMRLQDLPVFEERCNDWFVQTITIKIDRQKEFNELILDYARKN